MLGVVISKDEKNVCPNGALLDSQISLYLKKKLPNLAKLAEFCLDWTDQTRMGVYS